MPPDSAGPAEEAAPAAAPRQGGGARLPAPRRCRRGPPAGKAIATRSPGRCEHGHAVMEKIDGRFQVFRREIEPFRRPARAGCVERHGARDGALRQRQKRRIVADQIGLLRERKPRHILGACQFDVRPIAARAVEGAGGAGVGYRLAQPLKLPCVPAPRASAVRADRRAQPPRRRAPRQSCPRAGIDPAAAVHFDRFPARHPGTALAAVSGICAEIHRAAFVTIPDNACGVSGMTAKWLAPRAEADRIRHHVSSGSSPAGGLGR